MTSLQRYSDRRVLITGGGSGIGQATVLRILAEGGLVVAADISESGPEGHRREGRTVMVTGSPLSSWTSAASSRYATGSRMR